MNSYDARVTARIIRTEIGTTHTVYSVGEREFFNVDVLEEHLDSSADGTGSASPQREAAV